MPKLEPKVIQKELEQGWLWPVYWLYGQERMKSRELLKRIRTVVLGESAGAAGKSGLADFSEIVLDGSEVDGDEVLDVALSQSLGGAMGGGPNFVVVREAHLVKNLDALTPLLQPKAKRAELPTVCVLISKDLDGRKKFSKILVEKAAVVPCEEVAEADREAWVHYLMKRKGVELNRERVAKLAILDPWSLDIMDQELEKVALLQAVSSTSEDGLLDPSSGVGRVKGEDFVEALLGRDLKLGMQYVESFADQSDESLPLLGLLAWNARYLAIALADSGKGLRGIKLNPYVAERVQRWSKLWKMDDVLELQAELGRLDFSLKQTRLLPLGVWSSLVMRFCSNPL